MILGDGMMGQMIEPVVLPEPVDPGTLPLKPWILDGAKGRPSRIIKSLLLNTDVEEEHNWKLFRKYGTIAREIADADLYLVEDADLIVTTTPVSSDLGVPVIQGLAFLTGIGKDATLKQIIEALKDEDKDKDEGKDKDKDKDKAEDKDKDKD